MRHVLHVVDADLARGAQRGAQMLRDALDGSTGHRLITIFEAEPAVLTPDAALDITDGIGRTLGLSPGAVAGLRRDAHARAADVVIAHGGEALKYVAAAQLPGRIIYHKIGVLSRGFERRASARLHKWAIGHADAVVAISDEARSEAVEVLGVDPDRVTVIPNGRDPRVFRPDRRCGAGPPRIAFVGHLTRTKRPMWFLDVVERLVAAGFDLEATIAGDGPELPAVRSRALGMDVSVLGRCNQVAALLSRTDVLVFTSLREGEGMPGVLIEAALSGAVPVTTDVPGARSIVGDHETGIVVDVADLDALVEGVGSLIADPDRRSEMARAGRNRAIAHFSTRAVAAQWDLVCRRVVKGEKCVSYM